MNGDRVSFSDETLVNCMPRRFREEMEFTFLLLNRIEFELLNDVMFILYSEIGLT